jgi:hypothetical protein
MGRDELTNARFVLEEELWPACLLRLDGCIVYCNPAWDAFARENGGAPGALGESVTGMSWRSFIRGEEVAGAVSRFMEYALRGYPTSFLSECNSAEIGRVIMNRFEPVRSRPGGRTVGVAAVYTLVRSCPIGELHAPHAPRQEPYRDADGHLRMCAFCRRVKHRSDDGRWDFVPAFLDQPDLPVAQSYCNTCYALLCDG